MGHERLPRDRQEVALATIVAGGAAVAAIGAPLFIRMGGHTGAEYVYLGFLIVGPVVFVVGALIALLVYALGLQRVPNVVLAALTAIVVGAIIYVAPMIVVMIGLINAFMTAEGAVVTAATVFLSLWLAIAIRRWVGRTGDAKWAPRAPLVAVALMVGVAAGVFAVIEVIVANLEYIVDPQRDAFLGGEVVFWMLVIVNLSAVTAAWAVLVVLLVEQWHAPRVVRAICAGLLTASLLAAPPLVIGGGVENGGEQAAWGIVSGIVSGTIVFFSDRRVAAAAELEPVARGVAEG